MVSSQFWRSCRPGSKGERCRGVPQIRAGFGKPINGKHCTINFSAFMHEPVTFPLLASPIAAHRAAIP